MIKNFKSQFLNELKLFIETEVNHLLQDYTSKMETKDEWLTTIETCDYIKVTRPTLWSYCKKGILNQYYIGKNPRYKKSEIDNAFIKLLPIKGGTYD